MDALVESLKRSSSEDDRRKCVMLLKDHLKENPGDTSAWYDLACCFDYCGMELEAEPCYERVMEFGVEGLPESERLGFYVGYGSTLRNNSKFELSLRVLNEGMRTFPKCHSLKVFAALTLYSMGKYKDATRELFKTIDSEVSLDGYGRAISFYIKNLD